jgi:large exoprotein involved in heme utilization and adhesion
VTLTADSLLIQGASTVSADTFGNGNAGNVTVQARALTIDGGSLVSAGTFGPGAGGNISINCGSLLMNSGSITADTSASGDAGSVSVIVNTTLDMEGGAFIGASTSSSGNGGNVSMQAQSLLVGSDSRVDAETDGSGKGGNIDILSDNISVADSGIIIAASFFAGSGAAGNISIRANALTLGPRASNVFTGIAVGSLDGSDAPSGSITLNVDELSVFKGADIRADTSGASAGGSINIQARNLIIDGGGIATDTSSLINGGAGGDINVSADNLYITGGGEITAFTYGSGAGGKVTIDSNLLRIDSVTSYGISGIFAGAQENSIGDAGDVSVRTHDLTIADGAEISSSSFGVGNAGNVDVVATGSVQLSGGSSISTSSLFSDAGTVKLTAGGPIKLTGQSGISASAGQNGGNIQIHTPDLVYLRDSSITATAGTSGSGGTGGNITIDPLFIVLDNSLISANAAAGQGGNINLVSNYFFNSNSLITATGTTNNGTVNITAPELDLGAELITLPDSLVSAANQLQERCTALLQGDFSSFISIGRGGTEPEPDELQSDEF